MDPIEYISNVSGVKVPALKLIISLFLAYPIAWFYRRLVHDKDVTFKYYFFASCGIGIGVFNFGFNVCHNIAAVLFSYVSMRTLGPTKNNVIANLTFHMSYLLTGYWATQSESYDISWTTPHCVLVLKLIGLSEDLWDGSKDFEALSGNQKKTALRSKPQLVEIFAYVFFPASFLVGPQFSMVRLKNFAGGKLENNSNPTCMYAGTERGLIGIVYLILCQIGNAYFSEQYLLTETFEESSLIWKHFAMGVCGKILFLKYIACWLLAEGACITFGLAYNGMSEEGALWDGCRNVNLKLFEGVTKLGQYMKSFNINTNVWLAEYVYKRMAYLGNRYISQLISYIFLALWHGFHSGYYMTFLMEFVLLIFENDIEKIFCNNDFFLYITQYKFVNIVLYVLKRLWVFLITGYCTTPFALMSFDKWWRVFKSVYFIGLVFMLPWIRIYKLISKFLYERRNSMPRKSE